MAYANPRSWTDLAVCIPTRCVKYGAKVVYTKAFLMEELVVHV
jgi:hypothetical protein